MKAQSTGKYNKGFATLEILIAFAVLILSISAVILLVFGNQSIIIDSQTNSEALYKAQKMLEEARAASKFDFNLVNPIPNTADDIYTKNLAVSMVDFFTKNVTSNITWKVDGGRDQTISLYTLITNPDAINGGDTCNSVLGGDWAHPKLLGDVDVGQNNGATDVDVFMGKAYVTTDPSSVPKEDFHVIDVGNPNASPLPILKSINTGPGLVAVQVAGRYAYAANTSINGQLQVINISNASNPVLATTTKLLNVTGSGTQALGNSIFYADSKVYLGLTKTATGPEFNIIDVSNPLIPKWKGGYSVGHDINAIFVRGIFAYIASPDNRELIVLNISDPANPTLVGSLDLTDNSANGKSIAMVGNTLFLGRTIGSSPSTKEFQLINITNPINPITLNSANVNSTINAITIRDNLAFIITNDSNLGFQIWDLNTMTLYASKNVQQTSTGGMDCEGNVIYIAQRSNKALQIIGPGP